MRSVHSLPLVQSLIPRPVPPSATLSFVSVSCVLFGQYNDCGEHGECWAVWCREERSRPEGHQRAQHRGSGLRWAQFRRGGLRQVRGPPGCVSLAAQVRGLISCHWACLCRRGWHTAGVLWTAGQASSTFSDCDLISRCPVSHDSSSEKAVKVLCELEHDVLLDSVCGSKDGSTKRIMTPFKLIYWTNQCKRVQGAHMGSEAEGWKSQRWCREIIFVSLYKQ